jgi:GR25 family glycosyltransferase involved in LPS biosynthesis
MLSEVFEKVYVINMPRRFDRWEQFNARLPDDWPFKKPIRYEALDGGIVTPPAWWNGGHGAWGCYRTHLRIIEECLNRDVPSVLILEDDAVCVENFREKTEQFWQYLPDDWEMIYLGGQHIQENLRLPRKLNDWVYQPFNVNRCHCYGFRGRKMLERAYCHLNNFEAWNVAHHVDHYLGELHKKMEHGLYVPREWLVAQSEGQSDICGKTLELRLFPSTEETVSPKIDLPCAAVLGTYFSGVNTIAGVLKEIGVSMGIDLGAPQKENAPIFFEEAYLGEICRNSYTEPWLEEKLPYIDRVNHLRRWAGLQCRKKPQNATLLCGKHPILSLMGEEIYEAWNKPKYIIIDRPDDECYESMKQVAWCWRPTAAKYSFEQLRTARETFIEKYQIECLRIRYEEMHSLPDDTVKKIHKFLDLQPDKTSIENAGALIRRSQNDFCLMSSSAKQSV